MIVGAPGEGAGAAHVYYGGGGDGLEHTPRNRRGDDSAPAALLGESGFSDRFRIRSLGRSARGRALVAMDHQVAPLGTSLPAGTLLLGNYFDTGPTDSTGAAVNFGRLVAGLAPSTPYAWRMRFRARDPIFRTTRWISLPGNAPTEIDIRTSCASSSWYRDLDGDGFGDAGAPLAACTQPAGHVAVAGDCDDAEPAMFPGNPELCDGLDNDCNAAVDDGFSAPSGSPWLTAGSQPGTTIFGWSGLIEADRYDIVRGSLSSLRADAGNFKTSTVACLENDLFVTATTDDQLPAEGEAFWYLVRGAVCTAGGTYDSGGGGQIAGRDDGIASSGVGCP